ncbi:hypothetical protein ACWGH8_33255 [Nonomuraea muscovyensis]|uniref:hypothetical protein n=1 Tax=Nonomuraea muscovyensis TaxID=1124761 RepID=UPI00341088B5
MRGEQAAQVQRAWLRQDTRVSAGEAALCPQRCTGPARRRRLLHGVKGVRLGPRLSRNRRAPV